MKLLGKAEITIPALKKIHDIDEISLWTHIVLEEIDEKWTLHSCTWLKHIYKLDNQSLAPLIKGGGLSEAQDGGISKTWSQKPIYIFDNHNHALFFRTQYIHHLSPTPTPSRRSENFPFTLLHIDQHSDLNTPPYYLEHENLSLAPLSKGGGLSKAQDGGISKTWILEDFWNIKDLRTYTNYICQISTFIKPFLQLYPQTNFTRIKSESQLLRHLSKKPSASFLGTSLVREEKVWPTSNDGIMILDIDLDFRAPEMSIEKFDETIRITRQMIHDADLVTIATSPMFLDQSRALLLLHHLLD